MRYIVTTARFGWSGHVMSMEDGEMPKRITLHKPEDKRGIRRHKARYIIELVRN
jgi:hypothetical protein